jgi:cyclic nucleotide gated channel
VPQLQGKSEQLLQLICDYLKPVHYNQHSYIVREGEPLDVMLFVTQGIIWNFTTNNGDRSTKCIEKGSFYGEELLDWGLERSALPKLSDLPISVKTAKTHTKVEAFALMANDLRTIVSRRSTETTSHVQAASAVQAAFRRFHEKKNERSLQLVEGNKKIEMLSALSPKGKRS